MPEEALDTIPVEQVAVEIALQDELIPYFRQIHGDVEGGELHRCRCPVHLQTGHRRRIPRPVQVEYGRYQRRMTAVPVQIQFVDQIGKGVVLVLIGLQQNAPHALQIGQKIAISVHFAANRQQVRAVADQSIVPRFGRPAGHGDAHDDIVLTAQAVNPEGVYRKKRHKGSAAVSPTQTGHLLAEIRIQNKRLSAAAIGFQGGMRAVYGQIQNG